MSPRVSFPALGSGLALALLGVGMRVSNCFFYPTNWGFDAKFNWEYIEILRESWALPPPDAAWATAHPPLFYYLAACLDVLLGDAEMPLVVSMIRLLSTLAGLGGIALAVFLVRRVDPGNTRRAIFAAGLVLFLPAHIYMSAMLNEEILASAFISLALVGVALDLRAPTDSRPGRWRAAAIGLAAGLAWLTKLSGVLVVVAAVAAYALDGWRRRELRPALARGLVVLAVAGLVGGWFYARNLIFYGYLYPHALPVHEVMLSMPPGERGVLDYVRVPLATWTDPQLLSPDLLRSVWGGTHATLWYDGHRFFLPREHSRVDQFGTLILTLALLPTLAFVVGLGGGVRRALRRPGTADSPLLFLVGFTLAGYVLFTWRNPWFAAVKGSYLLGLSVPFAFYASDALSRWTRGSRLRSALVLVVFGLLVVAVSGVFSFGFLFLKNDVPGLPWAPVGEP